MIKMDSNYNILVTFVIWMLASILIFINTFSSTATIIATIIWFAFVLTIYIWSNA